MKATLSIVLFILTMVGSRAQKIIGISGGAPDQLGMIYSIDQDGNNLEVIKKFQRDGHFPAYTIIVGNKVYGTCNLGGNNDDGTLYEYDFDTKIYTKLLDFHQLFHGKNPADIVMGNNGILYGICQAGGPSGNTYGTLWSFDTNTNTFALLRNLTTPLQGIKPKGIDFDHDSDKIYGMTYEGGTNGQGVMFRYDLNTNSYSVLVSLTMVNGNFYQGNLKYHSNKLYTISSGTTNRLMAYTIGNSSISVIETSSADLLNNISSLHVFENKLYYFASSAQNGRHLKVYDTELGGITDLGQVGSGFVGNEGTCLLNGEIYFASNDAVSPNYEYVKINLTNLAINPVWSVNLTSGPVHSFVTNGVDHFTAFYENSLDDIIGAWIHYNEQDQQEYYNYEASENPDGSVPLRQLTLVNGRYYGVSAYGGVNNYGGIFSIGACDRSYQWEADFIWWNYGCSNSYPAASPLVYPGSGTKLYTTFTGGGQTGTNCQILSFDMNTQAVSSVYDFTGTNTEDISGLTYNPNDQHIYGMANASSGGNLIIFKYNPVTDVYTPLSNGALTTNDGMHNSNWALHSDGNFYACISESIAYPGGVIFRFNPVTNVVTILYTSLTDNPNGNYLTGKPTFISPTEFLGVTQQEGALLGGTIYKFNISTNTYTKLYDLNPAIHGSTSLGGLADLGDGNFVFNTSFNAPYYLGGLLKYNLADNTLNVIKYHVQYQFGYSFDGFILEQGDLKIQTTQSSVCEGTTIDLSNNLGLSGTWSPSNQVGSTQSVQINANTTIEFNGTNNLGCPVQDSVFIQVYAVEPEVYNAECGNGDAVICAVVVGNDLNEDSPLNTPLEIANTNDDYIIQSIPDDLGNMFIMGIYKGTLNIGGISISSNAGSFDGFIAKLNASGNAIWARTIGGADLVNADQVVQMALDEDGNVFLTGSVYGNFNFGPASSTGNFWNPFVARYNGTTGVCLWVKTGTCSVDGSGFSRIISDDTHIYVLGGYKTTFVFNGVTQPSVGPSSLNVNSILLKLDKTQGNIAWTKTSQVNTSTGNFVLAYGLMFGNDNDVIMVGTAVGVNTIQFGSFTADLTESVGIVVVKYNQSNGLEQELLIRSSESSTDGTFSIAGSYRLCNGDFLIAGVYSCSNFQFEGATLTNNNAPAGQIFVMRTDRDFMPLWQIGGGSNSTDLINAFTLSKDLNKYALSLRGNSDFIMEGKKLQKSTSLIVNFVLTGDVSGNVDFIEDRYSVGVQPVYGVFNHSVTGLYVCGACSGTGIFGNYQVGGIGGLDGFYALIGDPGDYQIAWSPSSGLDSSDDLSVHVTNDTNNDYLVSIASQTCEFSANAQFNSVEQLNAGSDVEICVGESVQLNAQNAPSTVSWSPSQGLSATNSLSPVASPLQSTLYVVSSFSGNCQQTDSIMVIVNPLPDLTITATSPEICIGEEVTLNAVGNATVTWNNGIVNQQPFAPTASNTYTVSAMSTDGCFAEESIEILVHDLPVVSAQASSLQICEGEAVTLLGGGALSYTWSNGAINGAPIELFETTIFEVVGEDVNGCEGIANVEVDVLEAPDFSINSSDQEICIGDSVVLFVEGVSVFEWQDNVVDNVPFYPTITSDYEVIAWGTNDCQSTGLVNVIVHDLPSISIQAEPEVICLGQSLILNGMGGVDYVWMDDVTDGQAFTPDQTQVYDLIGTDEFGCEAEASLEVPVYNLPTVLASSSDSLICAGDMIIFIGIGAVDYAWTQNIVDGVGVSITSSGVYEVIGTDENGCQNLDDVYIEVLPLPEIEFILSEDSICTTSLALTLQALPAGGLFEGDGVFQNSFDPSNMAVGEYEITYSYTSDNACTNSATQTIAVLDCSGIGESMEVELDLWPNPSNGFLVLNSTLQNIQSCVILSSDGKVISTVPTNGGLKLEMDVSHLAAGVYFLKINDGLDCLRFVVTQD